MIGQLEELTLTNAAISCKECLSGPSTLSKPNILVTRAWLDGIVEAAKWLDRNSRRR